MNRSTFNQTGGFPLKTERLQELQTAYLIFNSLGNIAGNLTILSGCEIIGSTVMAGFVYIDKEILEFRQSSITGGDTVIIIEEPIIREFENGSSKTVHTIRYAAFGTADVFWPWSEFKRPIETKTIPFDLVTQLDGKEEKTVVQALIDRIEILEARTAPQVKVTSELLTVNNSTNGFHQTDFTKNYAYAYPPSGYNMSHLAGFMASIAEISYAGDVDNSDTIWCRHRVDFDRVTIICANSEMRDASKINYMAVWIK